MNVKRTARIDQTRGRSAALRRIVRGIRPAVPASGVAALLFLPWLMGAAAPLQQWTFDDPSAEPLTEFSAPLEVDLDRPLWLVAEIRGRDAGGEAQEALILGLADDQEAAGGLVEIRLERSAEDRITIAGIGHARGTAVESPPLAWNRRQPISVALHYDPAAHVYQVYVREQEGQWKLLGTGATNDERRARFIRLYMENRSGDGEAGFPDVERVYLTHAPLVIHERAAETPPFVTATAWAVADAATGEILASHEADAPRKSASITKVMCALIVVRMAEQDPSVLDEIITFSELAAGTSGSHTGLAAGESLRLGDALYGLMLPSGNDAGNAIAEHFNDRFDAPDDPDAVPSSRATRANYIAEMNRIAAELEMRNTIYRSPFGDGGTAEEHTTTAEDLMLLARAAFAHPRLREIVGTRTYTATVTQPDGGTRQITWTNTNQLLGRAGYDGIKTGTTRLAGACVLSTGWRDDQRLFMVVLGSSYRNRRYIDSEALYEWAWDRFFPNGREE